MLNLLRRTAPGLNKSDARIVAAQAAKLDKRLPGWEDDIDLETLNLDHGANCILGQLSSRPEVVNYWNTSGLGSLYASMGGTDLNYPFRSYLRTSTFMRGVGSLSAAGFINKRDFHPSWVWEITRRREANAKVEAKARAKAAKHLRVVKVDEPSYELVA